MKDRINTEIGLPKKKRETLKREKRVSANKFP